MKTAPRKNEVWFSFGRKRLVAFDKGSEHIGNFHVRWTHIMYFQKCQEVLQCELLQIAFVLAVYTYHLPAFPVTTGSFGKNVERTVCDCMCHGYSPMCGVTIDKIERLVLFVNICWLSEVMFPVQTPHRENVTDPGHPYPGLRIM